MVGAMVKYSFTSSEAKTLGRIGRQHARYMQARILIGSSSITSVRRHGYAWNNVDPTCVANNREGRGVYLVTEFFKKICFVHCCHMNEQHAPQRR